MGTITLPNFRATADVEMDLRLKDGGVYIDWTGLTDIKAWIYSDEQKAMAGRCSVRPSQDDGTVLFCEYPGTKAQYLGVNRIIVQARYMGQLKTYDKPVFNFVRWTADQEGEQITIDDPHIEVEIEASDVSSTILERILAACVKATDEARDVVDVHRGPAAGFGTVDAEADDNVGTPEVEVETSGDDAAKNFHFKFKKIKGQQGERGPAGVESAVVTVDQSVGDPSATLSVENGVLTLVLSGIKGEPGQQGNSGYQGAAAELEIVNNDTEGGETAGWSAERGKTIREDHDALALDEAAVAGATSRKETLDPSDYPVRSYSLGADGKYGTANTYKHILIPCRPGDSFIVEANSSNSTYCAWFTSNAAPSSGGTAPLVSGTGRITISAGKKQVLTAPAGANYMYVYRGVSDTYPYTPASIVMVSNAVTVKQTYDVIAPEETVGVGLFADAVYEGPDYTSQEVDLSTAPVDSLAFKADNTFDAVGGHSVVSVEPEDIVKVTANSSNDVLVGFVSAMYCADSGKSVALISSVTIGKGETAFLKAPANAIGFIYNTLTGENDTKPAAITKYVPAEQTNELKAIPASRWMYSGGGLSYGAASQNKNYLFRLIGGHRYVFKVSGANAQVVGLLLSDLPYVGETYSTLFNLNQSYQQGKDCSLVYTPENDCYILFRLFKSSSPTYTVEAYDETDVTFPVQDVKDVSNTRIFWRLNYNAFTLRSRSIGDEGLYGSSTSYKHILLPVKEGQYIKIAKGVNNARLAWLTQDDTPSDYGVPSYVPGTSAFNTEGGVFRVPAGANYLFIYLGASPYNSWPSYIGYSVEFSELPTVVSDHDFIETRRVLFQLNSQTRDEINASYKPLVLLHYSDIHGSVGCQNRINEYRKFWEDYIDDTVQTGDLVTSHWGNGSAFGDESDPDSNPSKDILSVIGNHDTASYSGGSYSWHAYQGKQAYDRYIGPYVANWGVVQPEGAEENGYCFYYKDYTDSKVRLVVIDAFDTDDSYQGAQLSWFEGVLADAKENSLSVIVASHFRIKCESLLKSPFTKPGAAVENPDSSVYNDPFVPLVKAFIDAGGELVCWLTGHSHYDAISKTSEANGSQINVCISLANRFGSESTDLYKQNSLIGLDFDDWKTFDLFNIMAVDTVYKTISLFRVGSNWDKMGRRVETCCIKYKTGEILYP